ncbi:MAG TPA: hypothetical protein DCZ04_17725, partial [Syntrophorhabdus aromaticivorans]|nr:hypothetical protein [Syntrophorhabdus aromaticivorans]
MKLMRCAAALVLVLCSSAVLFAASWGETLDGKIDGAREAQVQSLQELLQIKSYNHGSPTTPSEGVKKALDH